MKIVWKQEQVKISGTNEAGSNIAVLFNGRMWTWAGKTKNGVSIVEGISPDEFEAKYLAEKILEDLEEQEAKIAKMAEPLGEKP